MAAESKKKKKKETDNIDNINKSDTLGESHMRQTRSS